MSDDDIIAGILRVEAQNDRSDWHAMPKPPLGEIVTPEWDEGADMRPDDDTDTCVCPVCEGDGDCGDPYQYIPCPRCGGSGRVDTLDDDEGDEMDD